MHVLFHITENEDPLPETVTTTAIEAAINFIEVCSQQTAYIAGRGNINDDLMLIESGKLLLLLYIYNSNHSNFQVLYPKKLFLLNSSQLRDTL